MAYERKAEEPCAMRFSSVTFPEYITPRGACFSYHLEHRGLDLSQLNDPELSAHKDSVSYEVEGDCPHCLVLGEIMPVNAGDQVGERWSTKQLIDGKEKGRRKGEPNQL